MNNIDIYQTTRQQSNDNYRYLYLFESIGESSILKVIEYSLVDTFKQKLVYNLGFGDYNAELDEINDSVNSNNNDMYKVFNTVLFSIVDFFENFPDAVIFVQGSDSLDGFIHNCKLSCNKNCKDDKCKNFNRRIRTYRNFVDKNFDALCQDYIFFGSIIGNKVFTQYVPFKNYTSILVYKKK